MPIMMSANGAPARMATVCRPSRPPNRRATAAAAPVRAPHMATFHALGCRVPLEESMPITIEAASAPLMKKMMPTQQYRYERRHRRQRELLQGRKQRGFLALRHGRGYVRPSEDGEPDEADQARDE